MMAPKQAAVVDGANVAHAEVSAEDQPRMSNLVAMRRALEARGYETIVIVVDASLRHRIDDPAQLEALIDDGIIHQAPAGTDADYFLLETADHLEGVVVSNDTFEDYRDDYFWVEERRLPFMIINGRVVLYDEQVASDR